MALDSLDKRIEDLQKQIRLGYQQLEAAADAGAPLPIGSTKVDRLPTNTQNIRRGINRLEAEFRRLMDQKRSLSNLREDEVVDGLTSGIVAQDFPEPVSPSAQDGLELLYLTPEPDPINRTQAEISLLDEEITRIRREYRVSGGISSPQRDILNDKLDVKLAKKKELQLILAGANDETAGIVSQVNQGPQFKFPENGNEGPTIFSGCDIVPVITTQGKVIELGNIGTLSYSTHRDKFPVRTLGRTYARGYTRGGRTIAGTLVWTVFDTHALSQLADIFDFESGSDDLMSTVVPDQLPPFDITITYFSEVPSVDWKDTGRPKFKGAVMRLYGVEIVDEGQNHSISDLYVENVMQFVARDIEHMTPVEETAPLADGTGIMRVTPFSAGKFNGLDFSSADINTLNNVVDGTLSDKNKLEKQHSTLISVLVRLDQNDLSETEAVNELYASGIVTTNRDSIMDEISKLDGELSRIADQLHELDVRKDKQLAEIRYKNITDPTRNFRDNPYDYLRPREL